MLIPFVDGFENDNSVENIQIYQDQFAIISTSDGILKIVEFFPNEILGKLINIINNYKFEKNDFIFITFILRYTHIKFYE